MKNSRFRSLLRRCCALALAAVLAVPVSVFAAWGDTRLESTHELLDGLTYTKTISEYSPGRLASFTLELDKDSRVEPILIQSSGTIYGSASINAAVTQAQEMGYQVLAAVNTDYFSTATGVPQGIVIEDGVYKSDADGNPAMVVTKDGVKLCEQPQVALTLTNNQNDAEIIPNYFNKYRASTGGVYLLNEYFSTVSSRTSTPGWFVRMEVMNYDPDDKDCQLTVDGKLKLKVTELLHTDQPITIGPGEYVLTADDVSNKGNVFASFQVGDRVTLSTECEDDDLTKALWAGGVGDILVQDGAVTDPASWTKVTYADSVRAPRTALGVLRDGTLVVHTVDGRQSKHSVGLTVTDLAAEMVDLGCRWAVNLDGGGSTAISVLVPGQENIAIQNSPSDGKPRPCATFLMLVSDKQGSGRADRLAFAESGITVLTGSQVALPETVVLDNALNVLDKDVDDLIITSRKGLGEIEDNIYIAGDTPGTDVLRLRSRDLDVTGEVTIQVVDELTEFSVTDETGAPIHALSVKPNEQVRLNFSGTYWGATALRDLNGVSITASEPLATMDETGLMTFASTIGQGATLTVSAGGIEKVIPVSLRNIHTDVGEDHWAYKAVEYCYANNIVSGISSTEFGATGLIRRCDFMLMLYAALGRPAVTTPCTFTDVKESDYYYTALAWAQNKDLISGGGDGSCMATAPINREQAFTILRKALPLLGKECPDAPLSALNQFADKDAIADYAKAPAATLVAQGVVSGSGAGLNPKGELTRAEMAALLYKCSTYTPITEYPDLPADPQPESPVIPDVPQQPGTPEQPAQSSLPLEALPAGAVLGVVTDAEPSLNVRSGPGTDHEVLDKVKNDLQVLVLSASEGWYQVLYRNEEGSFVTGYTSTDYISLTSSPGTVTDADRLNVRSGPGTEHEVQAKLEEGTHVIVAERLEGWYRILYRSEDGQLIQGYTSADYITIPE